ncbi:MAG: efflux transporter, family, subunit [Firmicutes bacterium]|nr:efflux transporter, family, subunit [Bacillota bacterium]
MSNELIKTYKKSHVLLSVLSQVCDFVGFKYEGGIEIVFSAKKMKACCFGLIAISMLATTVGCGKNQQAMQGSKAVAVKAMSVIQRDTPMTYEYAGQVKAKNEVAIQARVSGNIVEKLVNGGDVVHKGQPLFKIDQRQYESALNSAQATLSQSKATLSNTQLDRERYEQLVANDALDVQTLTAQQSKERENAATVDYNRANVKKAADDLADTVIVSPVDGRLDVNDLSVGTYVTAGSTTLATVSSADPVFVQFSMSENEYLELAASNQGGISNGWGNNVGLTLSNGSAYPVLGKVEQQDRSLSNSSGTVTGTLSFKASFGNPDGVLIPGMFGRVRITGETVPGAILIPQRAVQQLLEKTFVIVVGEDNKAESREVKLGSKVGSYYIVKSGVTAADKVVVEGLTKIQSGIALDVTEVTPEELQLSFNS